MKVIQRGIMKVVPGKMAEAMELEEQEIAIWSRLGIPPVVTRYRPLIVGGDVMHTVVYHSE